MDIIKAESPPQIEASRALFREYERFLAVDLCFQNFEQELATLPGKYASPEGALFLAVEGPQAMGCVAVRKLAAGICEMKRLYVRPAYQRKGLGRLLAVRVIEEAKSLGYNKMRLDPHVRLTEAMRFYYSLGFRR